MDESRPEVRVGGGVEDEAESALANIQNMSERQVGKAFTDGTGDRGGCVGERNEIIFGIGFVVVDVDESEDGFGRQFDMIANARGADGATAAEKPGLLSEESGQTTFDDRLPAIVKDVGPVARDAKLREFSEVDDAIGCFRFEVEPETGIGCEREEIR